MTNSHLQPTWLQQDGAWTKGSVLSACGWQLPRAELLLS